MHIFVWNYHYGMLFYTLIKFVERNLNCAMAQNLIPCLLIFLFYFISLRITSNKFKIVPLFGRRAFLPKKTLGSVIPFIRFFFFAISWHCVNFYALFTIVITFFLFSPKKYFLHFSFLNILTINKSLLIECL